jgi:hypothetical protein
MGVSAPSLKLWSVGDLKRIPKTWDELGDGFEPRNIAHEIAASTPLT